MVSLIGFSDFSGSCLIWVFCHTKFFVGAGWRGGEDPGCLSCLFALLVLLVRLVRLVLLVLLVCPACPASVSCLLLACPGYSCLSCLSVQLVLLACPACPACPVCLAVCPASPALNICFFRLAWQSGTIRDKGDISAMCGKTPRENAGECGRMREATPP